MKARSALMASTALLILTTVSCLGQGDPTGICQTSDGSSVNTHQLTGTWKLRTTNHTYEERDGIYLAFEARSRSQVAKGSDLCITEVDNGSPKCSLLAGAYDHFPSDKMYEAEYESIAPNADCQPYNVPNTETVQYSFSGSCNDTKLTLVYPNGASETFQWRGSTGSCKSQ